MGTKLLRVSHTPVRKLAGLPLSLPRPAVYGFKPLTRLALDMHCLLFHARCSTCGMTFVPPGTASSAPGAPSLSCEAFVDACADASGASLGGYVRLPDGRQRCFQHAMNPATVFATFPWFPADANPQHYVASE